jgi:hypothetical protein
VLPVLLAGYLVTWLQGSLADVDSDFEPISDSGFTCPETSRLLLVLALTLADAGVDSDFEPIPDSGFICSEPLLTPSDNDFSRLWTSYRRVYPILDLKQWIFTVCGLQTLKVAVVCIQKVDSCPF